MIEELNKYLEKLVNNDVFPGCTYGIITNHDTFFGTVGYKSLIPNKVENDINGLHDIASLTKVVVTNILVSFLVRDKKLKLDDYVISYLPEFKFDNVKIIHLLTHSSGIKVLYDKYNLKDKSEFLNSLDLYFESGSNAKYDDINFILLGFIIEKLYNKSLDILAHELIFEPLDMKDTCYNPCDKERCIPTELTKDRGLLQGVVHDEKAFFLNGVAGNAGVFSTVYDLSHIITMILNDGYYKGKQFIEKTYIDLWFTPLFIEEENLRRTIGWGYGKSSIIIKNVCSDDTIIHLGFTGHEIVIDRGNDLAIILLSNRIHPTRDNNKLSNKRQEINEEIYRILKKYNIIS